MSIALHGLIAAVLLAPISAAQPVVLNGARLSGPAVVVLWASWCTSCRAELDRLPSLATAAAPLPVRTLALDSPDRARELLARRSEPIDGAYADERDPRTVLDAWGGRDSVLPVAVALDRQGRICGRKIGLLGTDQLRDWAQRCSR